MFHTKVKAWDDLNVTPMSIRNINIFSKTTEKSTEAFSCNMKYLNEQNAYFVFRSL